MSMTLNSIQVGLLLIPGLTVESPRWLLARYPTLSRWSQRWHWWWQWWQWWRWWWQVVIVIDDIDEDDDDTNDDDQGSSGGGSLDPGQGRINQWAPRAFKGFAHHCHHLDHHFIIIISIINIIIDTVPRLHWSSQQPIASPEMFSTFSKVSVCSEALWSCNLQWCHHELMMAVTW